MILRIRILKHLCDHGQHTMPQMKCALNSDAGSEDLKNLLAAGYIERAGQSEHTEECRSSRIWRATDAGRLALVGLLEMHAEERPSRRAQVPNVKVRRGPNSVFELGSFV